MKVALLMVAKGGLVTGFAKLGSHLENKLILSVAPEYKINFRWIRRNHGTFFLKKYNLRVWETSHTGVWECNSKPKSIIEQINTTLRK